MSSEARSAVRRRLLDFGLKPGEGVDRRGRTLSWSLDLREVTLHGPTLAAITELMWPLVAAHEPTVVAGPSLSGDPLVSALLVYAKDRGIELCGELVRREAKSYGMRKLVEGPPLRHGSTAVIVDDVIMGGRSAARVVRALRDRGVRPIAVVTVADLECEDCERVDGVRYEALFSATELGLTTFCEPTPSRRRGSTWGRVSSPIADIRPLPVVVGGTVVIAGTDRTVARRKNDWHVVASGAHYLAAADDGIVVCESSGIRRIDAETLDTSWDSDIVAGAVCVDRSGDVLVTDTEHSRLLRISGSTGEVLERQQVDPTVRSLHFVDRDILLVASASTLVCHDHPSFAVRWRVNFPAVAPVAAGDSIYALTPGPALTRLDRDTGAVVWSRPVGRRVAPTLVPTTTGVVMGVEAIVAAYSGDNTLEWVHCAPRRLLAGPVMCGPTGLAFADGAGIVRVLRRENGAHTASYSAAPVRPIALAASTETIAALGVDGEAWMIALPQ